MIRGHGFLKYLKQSLIGFGISCSILLIGNSVSAVSVSPGMTSQLIGGTNTCSIGSDLSINCENSNHVMANLHDINGNKSFGGLFWSSDGIGVFHNSTRSGQTFQGLLKDGFFICSGDTSNYDDIYGSPGNCNPGFTKVEGLSYNQLLQKLKSSELKYWYNHASYLTWISLFYDDFYFEVYLGDYETSPGVLTGLLNGNFYSENFGFSTVTFTYESVNRDNSNVLRYPGGPTSSVDGSSPGNINSSITGDYTYGTCNYSDLFLLLETEGFNQYMCYGGLSNFDLYDSTINYSPTPGQGYTLNQIWSYNGNSAWDSFSDWYYFWKGLYGDDSYNSMWESYPAVFHTWFDIMNIYGKGYNGNPNDLYNYCLAKEYITGSSLGNNVSSYFKKYCGQIIQEKQTGLWSSRINGTIYSGGIYTGDTPLIPLGVNRGSGVEQKDATNFLQDFFNKAKAVVPTNYPGNGAGVLPQYIILFMLGLIFFRFLSH